jgi:hypothetical protein
MVSRQPNRPPRFRPFVEWLEDRSVPAGNVVAIVQDGVLFVYGDVESNQVSVTATGRQTAVVQPLAGTTLNGGTSAISFGDIKNGFDMRTGGGDDTLTVTGVEGRWIYIEGGDGADDITLDRVNGRHDLKLFGDNGAGRESAATAGGDRVTIINSQFRHRTAVDLGDGNDLLTVRGSRFRGSVFFAGQNGDDQRDVSGDNRFQHGPHYLLFEPTATFARPPVAVNDTATVTAGESVTVPLLANDTSTGAPLNPASVQITGTTTLGTGQLNADGSITFTAGSTSGDATFRYTVRNTAGQVSNEATVVVTITGGQVGPTTTITTTAATNPTAAAVIPYTVQFASGVNGFINTDVQVTNGTVSNFVEVNNSTYTFDVVPAGDGPVVVAVPAGVATSVSDGIGNQAGAGVSVTSIRTDAGMTNTMPDPNATEWRRQQNGLRTWDVEVGNGTEVAAGSTITVFYTGWLAANGTEFDRARTSGSPATFQLTNLIQGWQQGLIGLRPGGVRRLYIPSALGYGTTGSGSIPGNADLIFEIKLVVAT